MLPVGSLFSGIGGIETFNYLQAYLPFMANKYTYKAPCDEETLFRLYVTENKTQTEIAKLLDTSQHVIWRALKKMGIPTRKAAKRDQFGPNNSTWKGGRVLMATKASHMFSDGGYWYIKCPDHPNAIKNGYVAEHVLVATKARGSPLTEGETVHHKDLNKRNNSEDNLIICNRKQHRNFHLQLELIGIQLYRAGLVTFDDTELKYRLKEGLLPKS